MRKDPFLNPKASLYVFDFDGTLVDSNPIKWKAFETCFAGPEFSGRREEILAYCRANHPATRTEKFRHVYERILGRPYTPEVEKRLHDRFEQETTQVIIRAPEIPGASEFVTRVHSDRRTAVLSSTPHLILLEVLQGRGWSDHFDLKRGAPVGKAAWLSELQTEGFSMNQILFFGDTAEDAEAAEMAGCRFVGVGDSARLDGLVRVPDFRPLLS